MVLWGQLQNFSPFPICTCNLNQKLVDLQVRESVMKFLMGLNETFVQTETQVLLMDPIPLINRVCSLLILEEMQRNVGNDSRVESIALATKGQNFASNLGNNYNGNNHVKGK